MHSVYRSAFGEHNKNAFHFTDRMRRCFDYKEKMKWLNRDGRKPRKPNDLKNMKKGYEEFVPSHHLHSPP